MKGATLRSAAVALAALALACSSRLPVIQSFAADTPQISAGRSVVLRWTATDATSLSLDQGIGDVTGKSGAVTVTPAATTRYTLGAHNGSGSTTATATVEVLVVTPPGAVVLTASSTAPLLGTAVSLSWTASGASNFQLLVTPQGGTGPGSTINAGLQQSWLVRPLVATDYVVQALGAGGTTNSNTVTVAPGGSAGTGLSYTEPVPAAGDLVALEGGGVSGGVITLKLVALADFQAGAIALDLPLDGATAGSRDGSARVTLDAAGPGDASPGFAVAGLNVGSGTLAAAAAIPGSGPLAGVLTLGAAQKPACTLAGMSCAGSAPTDATFHAGDVIAAVRLKLNPAGGTGPVFSAATGIARGTDCTRGSGLCFAVRPGARTGSGPPGGLAGTLAVGTLTAN